MTARSVFSTARICIAGRRAASIADGVHDAIDWMISGASAGRVLARGGKVFIIGCRMAGSSIAYSCVMSWVRSIVVSCSSCCTFNTEPGWTSATLASTAVARNCCQRCKHGSTYSWIRARCSRADKQDLLYKLPRCGLDACALGLGACVEDERDDPRLGRLEHVVQRMPRRAGRRSVCQFRLQVSDKRLTGIGRPWDTLSRI